MFKLNWKGTNFRIAEKKNPFSKTINMITEPVNIFGNLSRSILPTIFYK